MNIKDGGGGVKKGSKRGVKMKKPLKFSGFKISFVELEGIEPSSKRGNNKLSTCLSLPKFSCASRTKAIN